MAGAISLVGSACGNPEDGDHWGVEVDTLPNGMVRVVNHPPDDPRPTWTLEEELRIGAVEGGGATTFGELKGLAVTEAGRIAVLDAQAREIRIFDPSGSHLATYGGEGSGPGELKEPYGLMWSQQGRLLVPDHATHRMSAFDPDSGFVESWSVPMMGRDYMWQGVVTRDGRVWEPTISRDEDRAPVIHVYGPEMALEDTLLLGSPRDYDPEDPPMSFTWEAPDGSRSGGRLVPYYPVGDRAFDPQGVVWSTDRGDPTYRIKRWRPAGDTALVIETRRQTVPVTESERDSVIGKIRANFREYGAEDQDWSKIPDVKPAVSWMFVDEDGRLWVRAKRKDAPPVFDIYERNGRLARVVGGSPVPAGGPRPVVRGDTMWAVVTDELGVDFVVRARIVVHRLGK